MSNLPSTEHTDLRAKIVERIRSSFVDLIPDDEWDRLVKSEIERFTSPQVTQGYGQTETKPSPLAQMVQGELQKAYGERLKQELAEGKYATDMWRNGRPQASEAVRELIKEEMSTIVEAAFGAVIQEAVMAIQDRMSAY